VDVGRLALMHLAQQVIASGIESDPASPRCTAMRVRGATSFTSLVVSTASGSRRQRPSLPSAAEQLLEISTRGEIVRQFPLKAHIENVKRTKEGTFRKPRRRVFC
jgi:hypothetical protein